MEYGNLVFGKSYALNKSNTKRVEVGLEKKTLEFSPVLRIVNGSNASKTITFTTEEWSTLLQYKDSIKSYLNADYIAPDHKLPSNEPITIELLQHVVLLKETYGKRSLVINECLPLHASDCPAVYPQSNTGGACTTITAPNWRTVVDGSGAPSADIGSAPSAKKRAFAASLEVLASGEKKNINSGKKMKYEDFTGVTMLVNTVEALLSYEELIALHVEDLVEYKEVVNQIFNGIVEAVINDVVGEAAEDVKKLLNSDKGFKVYCAEAFGDTKTQVLAYLGKRGDYTVSERTFERLYLEVQKLCNACLAREVYNRMFVREIV